MKLLIIWILIFTKVSDYCHSMAKANFDIHRVLRQLKLQKQFRGFNVIVQQCSKDPEVKKVLGKLIKGAMETLPTDLLDITDNRYVARRVCDNRANVYRKRRITMASASAPLIFIVGAPLSVPHLQNCRKFYRELTSKLDVTPIILICISKNRIRNYKAVFTGWKDYSFIVDADIMEIFVKSGRNVKRGLLKKCLKGNVKLTLHQYNPFAKKYQVCNVISKFRWCLNKANFRKEPISIAIIRNIDQKDDHQMRLVKVTKRRRIYAREYETNKVLDLERYLNFSFNYEVHTVRQSTRGLPQTNSWFLIANFFMSKVIPAAQKVWTITLILFTWKFFTLINFSW